MHDLIPMPASGSLTAIKAEAVLEPGRGKTKTGASGATRSMIGLGPDPAIRRRPMSTPGDRRGEHAIRGDASK
jgi:hypothetical protein